MKRNVLSYSKANLGKYCVNTILLVTGCLVFLAYCVLSPADAASLAERKIPPQRFLCNPEAYNAALWEAGEVVISTWKKELGVTFVKEPYDNPTLISKGALGGDFDVLIIYFVGMPPRLEGGQWLEDRFYASCEGYFPKITSDKCPGGGGTFNVGGYYNVELNTLLEKQKVLFELEERKKLVDQAVEMTVRDNATLVLYAQKTLHLMNTRHWKDEAPMIGEGLNSFWNNLLIKPKGANKTLRVGDMYIVLEINPVAAFASQSQSVLRLVYDSLVRIDLTGKPVPWMAEKIEASDGPNGPKTIIAIKLRENLKFHDGVPLTADDVVFTLDFSMKYKAPALARYFPLVDKIEKDGKYSVKLHLKKPWPAVSHLLLGHMLIIPKHIWEKVPSVVQNPLEWPNEKAIGSGPFSFVSWERGSQLILKRNEEYFHPVGPERLVNTTFRSPEMIAAAIERDEIDLQWGESMQPPEIAIRSAKKEGVKLIQVSSHGQQTIELKHAKRPYSDPVFRKALELCLPRKQMIDEIYAGFADFAVSSIPVANKTWHNPKVFELAGEFNPKKAREILKNAGYEWDAGGNLCFPPK